MYQLRWLREENVPVLTRSNGWLLKREFWIAGREERAVFSRLASELGGVDFSLENRFLVFHRVPAWSGPSFAVEVFGEAARLGVLYWEPGRGWSLHPSGALTSILEGLGAKTFPVETARGRLKNKKVSIGELGLPPGSYIIVRTRGFVGPARVADSSGSVKIKDLAPSGFRLLREPVLKDLLEKNRETIESAVAEARRFIREVYEEHVGSGKIPVSFSGGADSTAVLSLAVEELGAGRVLAIYTDTGLEFPETTGYVESIASKIGVELVVLRPETDFIAEIEMRGLMSVEKRWCTELQKIIPLRKFYSSNRVKIYLDGARDYESSLRERSPRIGVNPALPGILRALPIKKWPRMLVQLYLLSRKIPLNPLYDRGFTRIGCVVCPAMHQHELMMSLRDYREIHERILSATGLREEEYLSMKWTKRRVFNRER